MRVSARPMRRPLYRRFLIGFSCYGRLSFFGFLGSVLGWSWWWDGRGANTWFDTGYIGVGIPLSRIFSQDVLAVLPERKENLKVSRAMDETPLDLGLLGLAAGKRFAFE